MSLWFRETQRQAESRHAASSAFAGSKKSAATAAGVDTPTRLSQLMVPVLHIRLQQDYNPGYKQDILSAIIDGELRKLEDEMQVCLDDIAVNWRFYQGVK